MNRKIIVAAIGFVIAVAIGSHFYVEWQMARFDASLPTPPPPADTDTGGHWHGDEWHAEPHPETPAAEEPPVEVAPRALPRLPPLEEVNEELRAIVARPLPPDADELDREERALAAERIALNEKAHTLSEAEYFKLSNDLGERLLVLHKRFSKRSREQFEAIRQEAEAKRARRARAARKQEAVVDR